MIKLAVFDIDGTVLCRGEREIGNELVQKLNVLKSKGIQLAFASGRAYKSQLAILGELADGAYLICTDGAAMFLDGKNLYTRILSFSDVLKITRADEYKNCVVSVSVPDGCYVLSGDAGRVPDYKSGVHSDEIRTASALYDIQEPVLKVSVYSPDFTPKPLLYAPKSVRVCYNANGWCEYVSAIASKGLAVSDLQMRLYLSKYDTACFGDGQNDEDMMKKAKLAVSVNDAAKSLESVCGFHTDNLPLFLEENL